MLFLIFFTQLCFWLCCAVFLLEDISCLEEPISRSMISRRILKHLYGVDLQKLLEESYLLQVIGKLYLVSLAYSSLFSLYTYKSKNAILDDVDYWNRVARTVIQQLFCIFEWNKIYSYFERRTLRMGSKAANPKCQSALQCLEYLFSHHCSSRPCFEMEMIVSANWLNHLQAHNWLPLLP